MTMSNASCSDSVRVSWATATAEVTGPAPALAMLRRYLSPWFGFTPPHSAASVDEPSIPRLTIEHGPYREPPGQAGALRLHADLPGRRFRDGTSEVIANPAHRATYLLEPGRLTLRYASGECQGFDLIQIVRSLLIEMELAAGGHLVHAAALDIRGTGTLLTGAKGAGKTTSVLALTAHAGVRFVSNDKVLLVGSRAFGVPLAISVDSGIRRAFGDRVRHTSRRSAGGKELFFPCEMTTPPTQARQVPLQRVLDIKAHRASGFSWCDLDGDTAAVIRQMTTFTDAVHGTWVRGCLPQRAAKRSSPPAPVPVARLRFDPWREDHVARVLDLIVSAAITRAGGYVSE